MRGLTPKENEIAALIGQAMTNKQIAARYNCKEGRIKNHLKRIYDKLGIWNRVELGVRYHQERLGL